MNNVLGLHLFLLAEPKILYHPINLQVISGQTVHIKCEAHGNPAPHISWLYNGTALIQTADLHPVFSATKQKAGSILRITNVKVSHEGSYTCVARNILGTDRKSWNLVVYGKCTSEEFQNFRLTEILVKFRKPRSTDIKVKTSVRLKLLCQVQSLMFNLFTIDNQ